MLPRQRNASKIFQSITAPSNLKQVYRTSVRDSPARGRDGAVPSSLSRDINEICNLISRKTRAGTYRFTSYRQLLISKGAASPPRTISIASARDRIVLKSLAALIQELFPASKGQVAQRKVAQLQSALQSSAWEAFLRVDIKDFYPSLSHDAIRHAMSARIRKPEVLKLISGAIETPTLGDQARTSNTRASRGVPQGLPISNLLAEVAMQELDTAFIDRPSVFYLRYVDDIIIFCAPAEIQELYLEVSAACQKVGLSLHELNAPASKSKSGLITASFDYLGYVFTPSTTSIRTESIDKVKSSMARIFTRYKYEVRKYSSEISRIKKARSECLWRLNLVITGCTFDLQRRGWLHYFSQIDDVAVLKGLDATVQSFAKRFGLGSDFSPKTFTRAYWEITSGYREGRNYIPNFDEFSSTDQKNILMDVFHIENVKDLSDDQVAHIFYREIKRLVDKLEQDIGATS